MSTRVDPPSRDRVVESLYESASRYGTDMTYEAVNDAAGVWLAEYDEITATMEQCDPFGVVKAVLAATPDRLRRWACRSSANYQTVVHWLCAVGQYVGWELRPEAFLQASHPAGYNLLRALTAPTQAGCLAALDRSFAAALDLPVNARHALVDTHLALHGRGALGEKTFFDLTLETMPLWAKVAGGKPGCLSTIGDRLVQIEASTNPTKAYLDTAFQAAAIEALRSLVDIEVLDDEASGSADITEV